MTAEIPYEPEAYTPFAVTADIALFTIQDNTLQVVLVQRGVKPYRDCWALPGGFVKPDEDTDQAAARELAEETGLAEGAWHLEQLAAYGAPDRDPRMRVVTIAHWGICADLPQPRGGGDARKARLQPVDRIENGSLRLAFDHTEIVRDAVERIRSRMEHTALAAGFCPPQFTIRQLRQVYETLWDTRLDPGNFHRHMRDSGAFEQSAAPLERETVNGVVRRGRPAMQWTMKRAADGLPATLARRLARPERAAPRR